MLNLVSLTRPSLQILGKTQTTVFPISFIKVNFHNSRTSDDIEMKPGPVIKIDKKNKGRSKKADDDVMLKNCEVIVIFLNFF